MSIQDVDSEIAEALRVLRRAVVRGQITRKRARVVPAGPNMVARMTTGVLLAEVARRGYGVGEQRREMYARECERRHLSQTASFIRSQEDDSRGYRDGRGDEVAQTVVTAVGAGVLVGVIEERIRDTALAEQQRWDVVEADVENFLEETPGGDLVVDEVVVEPVSMGEMAQDFAFLGLDEQLVESARFADQFDQMPLSDAIEAQLSSSQGVSSGAVVARKAEEIERSEAENLL
ncbi:hypothetical protein [Corynebacterium mastitidis]